MYQVKLNFYDGSSEIVSFDTQAQVDAFEVIMHTSCALYVKSYEILEKKCQTNLN